MSDGPVTEDGKADYDAASARQFQRREPNPSAAKWEPGEFNECVCGACHVTSTFGGVRVIADPNLPHGHPGVILHSEDTAYADAETAVSVVDFLRRLSHDPAMRSPVNTLGGRRADLLRWTANEIVAHFALDPEIALTAYDADDIRAAPSRLS